MHHRSADGSTWFVAPAMAAALSRVLTVGGATAALAILESALIGPTQVAARLVEFGLLHVRIPSRGAGVVLLQLSLLGAGACRPGNAAVHVLRFC